VFAVEGVWPWLRLPAMRGRKRVCSACACIYKDHPKQIGVLFVDVLCGATFTQARMLDFGGSVF